MAFILRHVIGLAVDGSAGRSENDLLESDLSGRLHQVQKADHIDIGIEPWIGYGSTHIHLRGMMNERVVGFRPDQIRRFVGPNVELVEARLWGDVLFTTP